MSRSKKKGFQTQIAELDTSKVADLDDVIISRALQDAKQGKSTEVNNQQPTQDDDNKPKKPTGDQTPESTPTITLTQDQISAIAFNAAQQALANNNQPNDSTPEPEPEENDNQPPAATSDEIQSIVQNAIATANKKNQTEIDQVRKEAQQQINEANKIKQDAESTQKTVEDLFKLNGLQMPNFNKLTKPLDNEPKGLAADLIDYVTNVAFTKPQQLQDPVTGLFLMQKDLLQANNYVAQHFLQCAAQGISWRNSELVSDLETYFKAHGFFSGNGRVTNAPGPTIGTPDSVDDAFLDTLSLVLRQTHNQSNVWWQMVITVYNSAVAPSQNLLVPRFDNLPEPQSIDDFRLATTNTYTPVQAAIGTATDSQALRMTTVPITVEQFGLGKAVNDDTKPVFVPEFHQSLSLIDLLDAVYTRLFQNYFAFEDLYVRSVYEQATVVLYNQAGNAVDLPADVVTGGGGTFTEAFANSVYTAMFAAKMPTYPDGCYALVLNPTAANQYKSSLGELYRTPTEEQRQAVSNTFKMAHGVEIGRVSGYLGMYNNFHLFASNTIGVTAAGASSTVNNVTLGAGAFDMVDSFAFAPGCVGRGEALPAEIRASGVNPFQLGESYIWVYRGGVAPMDLDENIPNPGTTDLFQQTRCFRLRTTKVPV